MDIHYIDGFVFYWNGALGNVYPLPSRYRQCFARIFFNRQNNMRFVLFPFTRRYRDGYWYTSMATPGRSQSQEWSGNIFIFFSPIKLLTYRVIGKRLSSVSASMQSYYRYVITTILPIILMQLNDRTVSLMGYYVVWHVRRVSFRFPCQTDGERHFITQSLRIRRGCGLNYYCYVTVGHHWERVKFRKDNSCRKWR